MAGLTARLLATLGVAVLVGCSAVQPLPPPRMSAQHTETLASLREVDDHPLWTMTYRGDYDPFRELPEPANVGVGCSLFVASGDAEAPIFARNFDWDRHPALLLFTDPPDGYSSVSLVDLYYLGVTSADDLDTKNGKRKLLDAPLRPFDGMNETGLAIALAAVPDADGDQRPGRPTVNSVRILRLVLDEAATVDEAVQVFRRYNIDFSDAPPLHYLVADGDGRSAVIEFIDGKVVVLRGSDKWNAAVNFTLSGASEAQRQADDRYRTLSTKLRREQGSLDWRDAMDLLAKVQQPHTQWSVVYEQRTGTVRLSTGKDFDSVHRFQLRMRDRAR